MTPAGKGVVVVNRAARTASGRLAGQLRRDLPEAVILEARAGQDLAACLRFIAGGSARIIGVAGGDGTVNAGASSAQEMGLPLLVIPLAHSTCSA